MTTHIASPPRWARQGGAVEGFTVACACGWRAPVVPTARQAVVAGDRHIVEAAARRTGRFHRLRRPGT